MNNIWVKYILNFILIVLIQGLVVNNLEFSEYLNPMIYPVMIMLLPFEVNVIVTMAVALFLGLGIDAFSNTFGLHTSSLLVIAYLRPTILNYIKPRDGYDNTLLPSVHDMGFLWFIGYTSTLLFIHHIWFFTFEILRFDLIILILGKTFFSLVLSLSLIVIFEYIFYKPSKK